MAPDKKQHLMAGAAIAALAALASTWAGLSPAAATVCAYFAAALAGAVKELIDALGYGRVEWLDFLFTASGALPVVALWLLMR